MYPHHPSFNSVGALDGQFANTSGRFHNQIQPPQGVPNQSAPNYEFLGNQLPWKDPIQGQYVHQTRGFERSAEHSSQQQLLQSQQQIQQNPPHAPMNHQQQAVNHQFQANHQQVTVEQPEPPVQFPETSYSALLHGPDTPPFQPESAWDAPVTEPENHEGVNASYHGFSNNFNYNMEKDQSPDPQVGFHANPSMYGADGGAFQPQMLEHPNNTLNNNSEGMTMFPTFSQSAQAKDRSSLPMPKLQQPADQQLVSQNQISKGYQLSSSHHPSHDVAFRQQRNWGPFDQKWDGQNQGGQPMDAVDPSFQNFPNCEQNNPMQMHPHNYQEQQQLQHQQLQHQQLQHQQMQQQQLQQQQLQHQQLQQQQLQHQQLQHQQLQQQLQQQQTQQHQQLLHQQLQQQQTQHQQQQLLYQQLQQQQTQNQHQQYSTSVDMGNSRSVFSHYQQPGGNVMPQDAGFRQMQEWNVPPREMPGDVISNEREQQQYNSWNVAQMQKMPPGFTNHNQLGAPIKRSAWGTEMLQNGRYVVENDGPNTVHNEQVNSNSMQTGWQTSHVEAPDSMASMPSTNFQPYQEGVYPSGIPRTRQDSNSLSSGSKPLSHSLEAYEQYGGPWKSQVTQKQFAAGVDNSSYPSFNGDRNPGHWAPDSQQGTCETEAMPMRSGLMGHHDHGSNQQHNHRMLSASGTMQVQHNQNKPVQSPLLNQYAPDVSKDFSSSCTPDQGLPSYEKDDELEGPRAKRQREFTGFGNALPHIRPNHSPSAWPPQNMKFGMTPAPSLSKNLQPAGSMNQMKASGVPELERNRNTNIQPLLDVHAVETDVERESGPTPESQQHSHRMLSTCTNIQRTMTLPSSSPLIRQGSMTSDTPPGFSHGQTMSGENRGLGPPAHGGLDHLQMHGAHAQGKLPSGPNVATGNDPRQSHYEINNPQHIQDQPRSDPFMHQIGDRAKVGNLPDLLTNWKSSLSQQSMKMLDQTKSFPDGTESSRASASGVVPDASEIEPQLNMPKPSSGAIYGEDPNALSKSNIGNQSFEGEYNNAQHNFRPKQPVSVEAPEMTTPNAHLKPQLHRISPSPSSSSPLNGYRQGHLQTQNERQDWNQFMLAKGMSPQSGAQLGRFPRPPMDMLFPQNQSETASRSSHTQTHPATWASRVFDSAGSRATNETVLKHLHSQPNPAVMGKGGMHAFTSDGVGAHQLQNTSISESGAQTSTPADRFLTKDAGRNSNSGALNFELQRASGHYSRPIHNEQLISSQAFGYQNPSMHNSRDFPFPQPVDPSQAQAGHYSGTQSRSLEHVVMKDGEHSLAPRAILEPHQPLMSKPSPVTAPSKKRKSSVALLLPWHVGATQPRGQLISISKCELMWATATNRIPEKNIEENHDDNIVKARARLRLTTQLMQQIIPPVPSVLTQGGNPMDNECVLYNLSKTVLGEACRLMVNTEKEAEPGQKGMDGKPTAVHGQMRTPGITKEVALARLTERFTEKIKVLEKECLRLDSALSGADLKGKTQDLEKVSIVNRLARGYGAAFLDPSENVFVENLQGYDLGSRRPMPQKYVIAIPMPRTLPEDVRCLSL